MNIFSLIAFPLKSIISVVLTPIAAAIDIVSIVYGVGDKIILLADDLIVDKIPIGALKGFFQGRMIASLKKRKARIDNLITKISD